jgi:hypothetical protein
VGDRGYKVGFHPGKMQFIVDGLKGKKQPKCQYDNNGKENIEE